MKLSTELSKWRCDRPDEWKMDEFIRNAEKLESERDALAAKIFQFRAVCMGDYEEHLRKEGKTPEGHILSIVNAWADTVLPLVPDCLAAHDAEVAKAAVISFAEYLEPLVNSRIDVWAAVSQYSEAKK